MKNILTVIILLQVTLFSQSQEYSWRFYRPGNTGIMGDNSEALWIDHDGDPYIAAYIPGYEEGGFSKFIQLDTSWINYSNLEYPVMGSTGDVGSSRISDIAEDADSVLWMATWRGIIKFDPAVGGSSLEFWGSENSLHPGGRTMDIDVAPDGTIWAAVQSVTWGGGGLVSFNPATDVWQYWGYGSTANNWPSLIGYCEQVSVQAKPAGGYVVWIDGEGWNTMITFDSGTQLFTLLPQEYVTGEVVALPGNDCIDGEGNLWALRVTVPGDPFSLDYRTPAGNWITPAQPTSVISDIWVFKAFGNHEALITGAGSEVFQFTGTSWQSKGIWREGDYSYALDIDDQGNIWASGSGGAARRDVATGLWQRHRITNSSQIDYSVEDITIDDEGSVWMTGFAFPGGGGFQKFDGNKWTGYNEVTYGLGYPFPFPTDNTEAICFRPSNGEIVVNPMYNYLHSWDGSSYTSLNYGSDRSRGLDEDSQGRLWSLGNYYDLSYYNDGNNSWTPVEFIGTGANIRKDPSRPATVWACSESQVLRTDGAYNYSKTVSDFTELDPQSDMLSTVIPAPDGIAWLGSNQGLFKLNANNNTYQFFSPSNSDIPGENVTPLAYTSDGLLWFTNFSSIYTTQIGLCWFDGTQFGVFPVEAGGLPHAQIADMEVKEVANGYELWMSCLSMGIAVLDVVSISTLSVTPSIQYVPANPGSTNFSVTSNVNWNASSDQTWCTVTAAGSGNGTIVATYEENNSGIDRTAFISVTAPGVPTVVVQVIQDSVFIIPALTVSPSNQDVSADEGETNFTVISNITWNAISDQPWCTVTYTGNGDGTIVANYSVNLLTSPRIATITVSGSGIPDQFVTVTQEGAAATLEVTPASQNVPSYSGSANFSVTSNSDWTAFSDVTWCTVIGSGSGNGTLVATYDENNNVNERTALITITVSDLPPVIVQVIQEGTPIGLPESNEGNIRIYPNPAKDVVWISLDKVPGDNIRVSLMDMSGKTYFDGYLPGNKEVSMNVGDLLGGFYILKVFVNDEAITRKLILAE